MKGFHDFRATAAALAMASLAVLLAGPALAQNVPPQPIAPDDFPILGDLGTTSDPVDAPYACRAPIFEVEGRCIVVGLCSDDLPEEQVPCLSDFDCEGIGNECLTGQACSFNDDCPDFAEDDLGECVKPVSDLGVCLSGANQGEDCRFLAEDCPDIPAGNCVDEVCDGGVNDGLACASDDDCIGETGLCVVRNNSIGVCVGGADAGETCNSDDDCPDVENIVTEGVCSAGDDDELLGDNEFTAELSVIAYDDAGDTAVDAGTRAFLECIALANDQPTDGDDFEIGGSDIPLGEVVSSNSLNVLRSCRQACERAFDDVRRCVQTVGQRVNAGINRSCAAFDDSGARRGCRDSARSYRGFTQGLARDLRGNRRSFCSTCDIDSIDDQTGEVSASCGGSS